ncbi:hypothetical protein L1987_45479 [Smallanthus sonchifolius]|uniref:Uncharacterized protein n=1 Tax=Smallanthus sonchifolius TaxID=185202 RepID=A0ACB9FWX1_9ASTR|nr:hypothetical protein L1987_45479 [Smallanthus sonchifolius]
MLTAEKPTGQNIFKLNACHARRYPPQIKHTILVYRERHSAAKLQSSAASKGVRGIIQWLSKMLQEGVPEKTLSCGTHVNTTEPTFMYCITTTITDETATASATFFNEVVLSLLGKECKEVVKEGYENQHEIPRPFLEAIR